MGINQLSHPRRTRPRALSRVQMASACGIGVRSLNPRQLDLRLPMAEGWPIESRSQRAVPLGRLLSVRWLACGDMRCGGVAGLLRAGRWYLRARGDEFSGAIGGESNAYPTAEYLAGTGAMLRMG